MGFPDRIERTVEVANPPGKVWAALTTAEGLGAWFGDEATIDLRPGGSARMRFSSGFTVDMPVEQVEGPAVFGFTWQIYGLPEDGPRRAYVEFTPRPVHARAHHNPTRGSPRTMPGLPAGHPGAAGTGRSGRCPAAAVTARMPA